MTIDGSGGGTGMSPWRMMNEWGVPTVYIAALTYQYCKRLADRWRICPDIVLAGGLVFEDHIYKSFALLHPFIKKRSGCPDQPSAPPCVREYNR